MKSSKEMNDCSVQMPSLRITVRHHSASLMMQNSYPRDRIFNSLLTTIKDSCILDSVLLSLFMSTNYKFGTSMYISFHVTNSGSVSGFSPDKL